MPDKPTPHKPTVADIVNWKPPLQLDLFSYGERFKHHHIQQAAAILRKMADESLSADQVHDELRYVERRAHLRAGLDLVTMGLPSWKTLRRLVYERDGGICWVCNTAISYDFYECGHLHDRARGGLDTPDNLAAMHDICNRLMPPCDSQSAALEWRNQLHR